MTGDSARDTLDDIARRCPSIPGAPLERYLHELLRWNAELGLVAKSNPIATFGRLVIESAEFGDVVSRAHGAAVRRVADVGSGGGFPGIVWRLIYPQWSFTLIERRERKAAFLEQLVRHLALDVEVVAADARDVSRRDAYRETFDVVATMAVGEPARTAPQVEDLLVDGGLFATTMPSDAPAPESCGRRFVLEADHRAQFGRYATYRKRV